MSEGYERQKQEDEAFCFSCGAIIKKTAEICPECGVRQFADQSYDDAEKTDPAEIQAAAENKAFCFSCGAIIKKTAEICPECGVRQFADQSYDDAEKAEPAETQAVQKADTAGFQAEPDDVRRNKGMAILAYILFFIPLVTGRYKKSPFVKHHTNQGTLLFLAFLAVIIAANLLILSFTLMDTIAEIIIIGFTEMMAVVIGIALLDIAGLLFYIIGMIKGIINAAAGKMKPLPAAILFASPFVCALVAALLTAANFSAQSPLKVNYKDMTVKLVGALSSILPSQSQKENPMSDFTITIYDDYFGSEFALINYGGLQIINLEYIFLPAEGAYSVRWGNVSRNSGFGITFPNKDLSYHAINGYVLEFKAKTEKQVRFELKFYSKKDNIYWQSIYSIDQRQLPPDGIWHTIRIPLNNFQLLDGLENGQWVPPRGDISWDVITRLEFRALHEDGAVYDIYLDSIKITE